MSPYKTIQYPNPNYHVQNKQKSNKDIKPELPSLPPLLSHPPHLPKHHCTTPYYWYSLNHTNPNRVDHAENSKLKLKHKSKNLLSDLSTVGTIRDVEGLKWRDFICHWSAVFTAGEIDAVRLRYGPWCESVVWRMVWMNDASSFVVDWDQCGWWFGTLV